MEYGNEASLAYQFSYAAILVVVPPSAERVARIRLGELSLDGRGRRAGIPSSSEGLEGVSSILQRSCTKETISYALLRCTLQGSAKRDSVSFCKERFGLLLVSTKWTQLFNVLASGCESSHVAKSIVSYQPGISG